MAAIDLEFDLKTGDGRDVSAMQDVIAARVKELGETTKQGVVAITINILKSLRQDTLVAKVKGKYEIKNVTSQYYPGWARVGGANRRVLRAGRNGGQVIPEVPVVWKSQVGYRDRTYRVRDFISTEKVSEYLLVTSDAQMAKKFVSEYHEARVKRHRGLARTALGVAMHEVHKSESIGGQVSHDIVDIAEQNVQAQVHETGYDAGDVSVHVHDKLDYSAEALKHGPNYVQTAVQKALNKMTAYIISRLHGKDIQTNMKIPYPELKEKTA